MANHWLSGQQKDIFLGFKADIKIKILLKSMEINASKCLDQAIKFKQITFFPSSCNLCSFVLALNFVSY